jgi:TolA-binding protein
MSTGFGESPFKPGYPPMPAPPPQGTPSVAIILAIIGGLAFSCCCGGVLLQVSLARALSAFPRSPNQFAPLPSGRQTQSQRDAIDRVKKSMVETRERQDRMQERIERSRQESQQRMEEMRRQSQERMRRMSEDMQRRHDEQLKQLEEFAEQSREFNRGAIPRFPADGATP